MAVVLKATSLRDHYGKTFTVEIIDTEVLEGSGNEIEVSAEGIRIDYQGSTDDPHSRIITSTASVTFMINDPVTHEFILERLILAKEGVLFMKIYANVVLMWNGPVVVDRVNWEDQHYPYPLTISANDGLGNLRGFKYKPSVGVTPYNLFEPTKVMKHITDIIGLLQYGDLYGSNAALQVAAWWYEDNMANTTDNPLDMTWITYWPFTEEKDLNQYEYMSAYDALHMICLAFNARLYHASGLYIFEQINYRSQDTSTVWLYRYNGTYIGTLPISNEGEVNGTFKDMFKETGGTFTLLPPVKEIRLKYKYKMDANFLRDRLEDYSYLGNTEQTLASIDRDAVEDIRLILLGKLRWEIVPGNTFDIQSLPTWKLRFAVRFRVGDKWLRRQRLSNDFYGRDWETPAWVDTADYYYFETDFFYADNGVYLSLEDISILTPPIESDGDVRFDFFLVNVFRPDVNNAFEEVADPISLDFLTKWWLLNPFLGTTLGNGDPFVLSETNYLFEGQGKNTRVVDLTITIGDGPNTSNPRRVQVWDGTKRVESSQTWSPKGQTVGVSLQRLLLLELAQLLDKPLKLMNANIIHYLFYQTPYRVLNYQGDRYIFMSGSIVTTPGDFNGTWFLMNPEDIE
jgi:hypothetical protein